MSRILEIIKNSANSRTLESGIDVVGQGINVGPGKFEKKINIGPWIKVGHGINVGPGKFEKKE